MPNAKKLPADVYYTAHNGGMYVRWNGRPEGPVSYTYSRDVAYGASNEHDNQPPAGMYSDGWAMTPFQGANGSCRRARIIAMAAKYSR